MVSPSAFRTLWLQTPPGGPDMCPPRISTGRPVRDGGLDVAFDVQGLKQRLSEEMLHCSAHASNSYAPCLCLHHVILVVDEFKVILGETVASLNSPVSIYRFNVVLAAHKEILPRGIAILGWNRCSKSTETMTTMKFRVGKLACVCHCMAAELGEQDPFDSGAVQVSSSLDVGCTTLLCGLEGMW